MRRVAFIGDGTVYQWRKAVAYLTAESPSDTIYLAHVGVQTYAYGVVSRYEVDEDMLSQADACVVFAPARMPGRLQVRDYIRTLLVSEEGEITMAESQKRHEFLWFDLETTGLDPQKGAVLEFAAVLCEDARGDNFTIVEQYTSVIHQSAEELKRYTIAPTVQHMHERNGLWIASAQSTTTTGEVDAFLAALAQSITTQERSITLAGNSIQFDRAWCKVHFPQFDRWLSHRLFDVRVLMRTVDAWGPPKVQWPAEITHRALPDVLQSIERARIARNAMGW